MMRCTAQRTPQPPPGTQDEDWTDGARRRLHQAADLAEQALEHDAEDVAAEAESFVWTGVR